MLQKLHSDQYDFVRPLFAPLEYNLAIDSILAGLTPGSVYVDDVSEPELAVTWTRSRVFLSGHARDAATQRALQNTVLDGFYPECASIGPGAFTLYYTPGWREALRLQFADQHLMRDFRHYYTLDANEFARQVELAPGYELAGVDVDLLANSDLSGLDVVRDEMISERPSVDDFLKKSFGYCVIHDGAIAAWCMSEYNCDDRCEIGIWTNEANRRHGLALATATAVIGKAHSLGINRIGWHCWMNNYASRATALKLGFVLQVEHPVFFAYTDPLENLASNGYMSLRDGDAQRAMYWFDRAAELGELPQWAVPFLDKARTENNKGDRNDQI